MAAWALEGYFFPKAESGEGVAGVAVRVCLCQGESDRQEKAKERESFPILPCAKK